MEIQRARSQKEGEQVSFLLEGKIAVLNHNYKERKKKEDELFKVDCKIMGYSNLYELTSISTEESLVVTSDEFNIIEDDDPILQLSPGLHLEYKNQEGKIHHIDYLNRQVEVRSRDGVFDRIYIPKEDGKMGEILTNREEVEVAINNIRNGTYLDDDDDEVDMVNSPSHYLSGKFETIDVIEHIVQGYDSFTGHCIGTVVKYLDRAPYKHESPVECLKKAAWYLNKAIESAKEPKEVK